MLYYVFDLDGTLTNPVEGITGSVMYALKKLNIEGVERKDLLKFIGPPLTDSFSKYFGLEGEENEAAVSYYRETFAVKGMFENEIYEGIEELLDTLSKNGKKIYLATSKPEEYAVPILENLSILKYFDFVAGNTLKDDRLTKESVIEYLLKTKDIDPKDAVMVGDRKFDIIAGHRFGLTTVGVTFGFAEENELENAGADYIADSVSSLKEILLYL